MICVRKFNIFRMPSFLQLCLLICLLCGIDCIYEDDETCVYYDKICLNSWDVASYEAIRTLHAHLDDDQSGDIDLSESVEFLREELNYTEIEKQQNFFHPNNDNHISVQELWNMWIDSEVHNWTVENTVSWLCLNVELFQYAEIFQEKAINGSFLPRLATNNDHFLTRTLGIKNPAHRSKIAIKAMDAVLFGAPKDTGSYLKDITIVLLITFLIIGAFRFYHVQKDFDRQRSRMVQEMEALNAEERKFREELHLRGGSFECNEGNEDSSSNEVVTEVSQNETTTSVKWNDDDSECAPINTSSPLQMWLQLSYERERASFDCKCQLVEAQLREAKEMCEKLHPSKKQFFASLGLVHGKTEPKYNAITEAVRDAIADIKLMHKEMEYRWNAIEKWTNCEIIANIGLTHLEFLLEPEIHCPSSSSTVGLGGATQFGFKNSNLVQRKRKKDNWASPETASIRSTCSLPTQNSSCRLVGNLHQSQTVASALGNINTEYSDIKKESKLASDSPKANHVPISNSSTMNGSNPHLISDQPKKDDEVSETVEVNSAGNSTLPQNDNKFKSEPTLETDVSVVSESTNESVVNGTELVRSKRRSKFFRSKIFDKLKTKTDRTSKFKENT